MAYKTISPVDLIEKFKYALDNKWGYIWGTAGVLWTEAKQKALEKTTDPDRESGRLYGSKWIGHTVADCSGLFSWAFDKLGSYMYHGSDTMWNKYCVNKGELRKGKRTDGKTLKPGTAVFTYNKVKDNRGHVGLYVGDGLVIEAAGTKQGVITSKVTASKWVEWGELKYVNYGDVKEESSMETESRPTIKYGSKGDDVTALQQMLSFCGSTVSVDGIFGNGTRSAVVAFQNKHGLKADGIVGPKTWAALDEAVKTGIRDTTVVTNKITTVEWSQLSIEEKVDVIWTVICKHFGTDGYVEL